MLAAESWHALESLVAWGLKSKAHADVTYLLPCIHAQFTKLCHLNDFQGFVLTKSSAPKVLFCSSLRLFDARGRQLRLEALEGWLWKTCKRASTTKSALMTDESEFRKYFESESESESEFDLIACERSTFGNDCILSSFFSFILTSNKFSHIVWECFVLLLRWCQ